MSPFVIFIESPGIPIHLLTYFCQGSLGNSNITTSLFWTLLNLGNLFHGIKKPILEYGIPIQLGVFMPYINLFPKSISPTKIVFSIEPVGTT